MKMILTKTRPADQNSPISARFTIYDSKGNAVTDLDYPFMTVDYARSYVPDAKWIRSNFREIQWYRIID